METLEDPGPITHGVCAKVHVASGESIAQSPKVTQIGVRWLDDPELLQQALSSLLSGGKTAAEC
jgi:hypothetical protein